MTTSTTKRTQGGSARMTHRKAAKPMTLSLAQDPDELMTTLIPLETRDSSELEKEIDNAHEDLMELAKREQARELEKAKGRFLRPNIFKGKTAPRAKAPPPPDDDISSSSEREKDDSAELHIDDPDEDEEEASDHATPRSSKSPASLQATAPSSRRDPDSVPHAAPMDEDEDQDHHAGGKRLNPKPLQSAHRKRKGRSRAEKASRQQITDVDTLGKICQMMCEDEGGTFSTKTKQTFNAALVALLSQMRSRYEKPPK